MLPQLSLIVPLFTYNFCTELVRASLYTSPDQLRSSKTYDFIIVGGGAGGGVLANRLTEEVNFNVLLIEAGSSDYSNLNIEIPQNVALLANSQFDWNFTTVEQPGANGRAIPYTRGFVLGGSTSVNFMAYSRGSRDDFDRWARATDDTDWSFDALEPYMRKLERVVSPIDGRNTTGEIEPSVHGHSGPVNISLSGYRLPTDDYVIDASAQLSSEFPFNIDYNSGNTIGVSWVQSTISNGQRVNSARAYIAPALSRPNLDVLVNTHALKVLRTGTELGKPIFRGIQLAQSNTSTIYSLTAKKEIILSSGAVKTPHILMLSGIGDASVLQTLNIETIIDLPDVGLNLQDQPLVTSSYTVNSTNTLDNLRSNETFHEEQLALWIKNRTGELGLGPSSQWGWLRLPKNSSVLKNSIDPSAGPTSAHYELIFTDGFISFSEAFPGGNFFTVFTVVVSPNSRGNITLGSTNPFDSPIINPGFLGTDFDISTMREAIKAVRRYMSAPAWEGYILGEHGAFAKAQTDAQIEDYARNTMDTINHVCCTAAMGRSEAYGRGKGVLNSDLTVKGTVGLRVVDASSFPFIPASHTQAPTYILAERAADLIKSSYLDLGL